LLHGHRLHGLLRGTPPLVPGRAAMRLVGSCAPIDPRLGAARIGAADIAARGGLCYRTGHGFAFQISEAYSAMVRSLENFPEQATFTIALRAQPS
jgi:hypothetical protein